MKHDGNDLAHMYDVAREKYRGKSVQFEVEKGDISSKPTPVDSDRLDKIVQRLFEIPKQKCNTKPAQTWDENDPDAMATRQFMCRTCGKKFDTEKQFGMHLQKG